MKKLKKRTKIILICLACLVVLGLIAPGIKFIRKNFAPTVHFLKRDDPIPADLEGKVEYYAEWFLYKEDYDDFVASKVSGKLNDNHTMAIIKVYYDDTGRCYSLPTGLTQKDEYDFLYTIQPRMRESLTWHFRSNLWRIITGLYNAGVTLDVYVYTFMNTDNLGNPQYDLFFHGKWTPERLNAINWEYMERSKLPDSALEIRKSKIYVDYPGN